MQKYREVTWDKRQLGMSQDPTTPRMGGLGHPRSGCYHSPETGRDMLGSPCRHPQHPSQGHSVTDPRRTVGDMEAARAPCRGAWAQCTREDAQNKGFWSQDVSFLQVLGPRPV